MYKSYKSLPLRAQEDVIEEFGVSRKYTNLLIGAGLLTIVLGIVSYLGRVSFEGVLESGAGALAPLLAVAFWIGLLILGIYIASAGFYLQLGYQFFLTNQRVIETVGLLAQRTSSSDYGQINDIVVRQDFINRLFLGTGTIGISTPGTASEEYQLINVDRPVQRRELIRDLIRSTNEGRHIDKYMIAHLMVKNGLVPTEQDAFDQLDLSVGKDPAAEATFGVISPEFQKHNEDFHGAAHVEDERPQSLNQAPVADEAVSPVAPAPAVKPAEPAPIPATAQPELSPSVSPEPVASDSPVSEPSPAPTPQPQPIVAPVAVALTDADVVDLLGDGIDESDRLRAAQRNLDNGSNLP